MKKIKFEDGTLAKPGYVTINGTNYDTIEPVYNGKIPLNANNLNQMQDNVEEEISSMLTSMEELQTQLGNIETLLDNINGEVI